MILQALYALAKDEQLVGDPDYEWKEIPWLVRVGPGGKLLGIEGTRQAVSTGDGRKTKPKLVAKTFLVPREKGRTSGGYAFFFFDKTEYVFGMDPDDERPSPKSPIRAALFLAKVQDCANATKDDAAMAIATLLTNLQSGQTTVILPEDCTRNDLFAFIFVPDQDTLVTSRPKIQSYWKHLRSCDGANVDSPTQCLVTGQLCTPVGKHPVVKRVPGGTTSGVAVISFNSDAFESYGWKRNDNAPVSRDAAENCATALNRLLSDRPQNAGGEELPVRNLRLSSDTAVCFWAAGKSDAADYLAALLEANPEKVRKVYQSIWRGKAPQVDDPKEFAKPFYAITISGAQGRAVIRDWLESTVAEALGNLAEHFADLEIVRNTPKPKDHDLPPQLPLRSLLRSLSPQGSDDGIPAPLAGQFVSAALCGREYPLSLLQRALERTRAEIGKTDWADLERRDARAAIIKAVLNRRKRFHPKTTVHYKELTITMDPNNDSPGYLLGRLSAVIERMQQLALGDVNASVIDRFFSGASATPAAVFPRLLRGFQHHARKAMDGEKTGGAARWLKNQADDILSKCNAVSKDNAFPAHLDMGQQGLFILGYHHMRHWLWLGKDAREKLQTEQVSANNS